MVAGRFLSVFKVPVGFNGSGLIFIVFQGYRLVFHGSRSVFMLQVGFHSFSWFQVGLYGF